MDILTSLMNFANSYGKVEQSIILATKPEGLSPLQYRILILLAGCDTKTPGQIAECLNLSMPNASRELKHLQTIGFIQKDRDTVDKRSQLVSLTPSAHQILNTTFTLMNQLLNQQFSHLSSSEIAHMVDAFNTLSHLLNTTSTSQNTELHKE
jgi:DNA-binding MarR family transcriptional regulator